MGSLMLIRPGCLTRLDAFYAIDGTDEEGGTSSSLAILPGTGMEDSRGCEIQEISKFGNLLSIEAFELPLNDPSHCSHSIAVESLKGSFRKSMS